MKTGDRIEKPWGWEHVLELNDRYCIKHLFVRAGHRLSEQYHERKRETLILLEGEAELALRDGHGGFRDLAMKIGEPLPLEPGEVHRLRGVSEPGALVLEVSTPEVDPRPASSFGI